MSSTPPPIKTVPAAAIVAPRRLDSSALFKGAVEVEIVHNGALYRLRETQLGKLILTK
jgi:hemin uptake protein HemP